MSSARRDAEYTRWELSTADRRYPDCLHLSPEPPAVLYGCGDRSLLRPGLAIIGARRATPYGLKLARMFAGWAAERGVVIVSGAARGCDAAAHEAALDAGGRSVAVLGCGADVDYPPTSARLLATMRAEHAVVSECPWGQEPLPYAFPRRNRIIAALSAAVLVVEASLRSGTFTTAEAGLKASRDVLAVPGSVFSPTSFGCNRLISQGAQVVTDISDLAGLLRQCGLLDTYDSPEPDSRGQGAVDSDPPSFAGLGAAARATARALIADPMRPDDAARALCTDVVSIARILAVLEQRGIVARYPDGRYGP